MIMITDELSFACAGLINSATQSRPMQKEQIITCQFMSDCASVKCKPTQVRFALFRPELKVIQIIF